jgi:hypothetical protein
MEVTGLEGISPVFIGGTQRSGTSLLRALIDSNTDIYFPPAEMKFFVRFYHRLKDFEPLSVEENRKRFLAEYGNYRKIVAKSNVTIESELLGMSENDGWSWPKMFGAIMRSLASSDGKERWGEKSPGNEFFTEKILHFYPESKIICTLRDPQGVVASSRRRYGRGFIRPLLRWKMAARKILFDFQHLPLKNFYVVFYEDLVLNLQETTQRVFQFVEARVNEPSKPLRIAEGKWGKGGKSSYGDKQDKEAIVWRESLTAYRHELTALERRAISIITREERALLGYYDGLSGSFGFRERLETTMKSGDGIRYYPAVSRAVNLITDRPLRL